MKDGTKVSSSTGKEIFFSNLEAGDYTYKVEADGFKTLSDLKASTPKNKNLKVFMAK